MTGLTAESLNPCDWGLYTSSGKNIPTKTCKSAFPSVLLKQLNSVVRLTVTLRDAVAERMV